jgi:hypothetical protein
VPKALSAFVRSVLATLAAWHQGQLCRPSLNRFDVTLGEFGRSDAPQNPEAYFVWGRDDLIATLQAMLVVKDSAKLKRGITMIVH